MIDITHASAITEDITNAFARLLSQLSPDIEAPSLPFLESMLKSKGIYIILASENKHIVGITILIINELPSGNKAWIEDVVTDHCARGKGVGGRMIEYAIGLAKAEGIKNVNLTSAPERTAANKLYQKLGFEKRETNVYRLNIE